MKRNGQRLLILSLLIMVYVTAWGQAPGVDRLFRTIGLQQGLSNSQVNCLMKDSRGFVWLGTMSGLNRFDGVRFKTFHARAGNKQSIINDCVNQLFEDFEGNIWVETAIGYCVYHPVSESFDQHPEEWMKTKGMEGIPHRVYVDSRQNLWIAVIGKGLYRLSPDDQQAQLFPRVRQGHQVTSLCETPQGMAVVDDDGLITLFPTAPHQKNHPVEQNGLLQMGAPSPRDYFLFVDHAGRYWVSADGLSAVFEPSQTVSSGKWYPTVAEWLTAHGMSYTGGRVQVKDLKEDKDGNLWMATDHSGLMVVTKDHHLTTYLAQEGRMGALPDNTLQCVMFDENNALWVGTLKNGAAFSWEGATRFPLLPLGDVCTLTEDRLGNIWCGTNDRGIVCYQPLTGTQRIYRRQDTGLGSDVVVSSLCAHDGTLWFGTFNGGLAHYVDGHFQVYRTKDGLSSDNIWALAENAEGHILIGTLGGGVQELDVKTGKLTTYNYQNARLASDYISSLCTDQKGNVLIGHSQNFSIMKAGTRKIENFEKTRDGQPFVSPEVNQVLMDSRGLIWDATASGVNVYDPVTDQLLEVSGMGCSVTEDLNHDIWIVSDIGLSQVKVSKQDGQWQLNVSTYDSLDGLQSRQFNYRSILVTQNGDILIGGQDGVNVVPHAQRQERQAPSKALFSGLILFDHPLAVGEEYNGRVVLKEAINESRHLVLDYDEKDFTIQLAATSFVYPSRKHFLYRLKGFNDQWMRTPSDRSEVTYTNLSPGTYHLEVKVLDRYGNPYPEVSELVIVIRPPFYMSLWAILFYVLLAGALLYYVYYRMMARQKAKFAIEQVKREAEQERKMDMMKMRFYTNVSHELRTPLTLIISPLAHLIRKEDHEEKKAQLTLIHRNAERLLTLVNDILDFRKLDANKMKLNLVTGDLVARLRNICSSFQLLQDKPVTISFDSNEESLVMKFDDEKMTKVINNLLSNAYKFTNEGTIQVSLKRDEQQKQVMICVSDTGIGISDTDKQHIFERFYQAEGHDGQSFGGSGVGLSMVKDYVEMHGGSVSVTDNPGGGTVFTLVLPLVEEMRSQEPADQEIQEESVPMTDEKAAPATLPELLLVDDSEDFLEFMTSVLEDSYHIRVAHHGEEALARIEEKKPDIILSDVMMPLMDGVELCRRVKGNPATARIPFVMLTARMASEHKIEGLESGADDYITKPFDIDLLTLRMNNLFKWRDSSKKGKLEPQLQEIEITSLDEKLVKEATSYVEENISNTDLSVETLSIAMNMSRVHLYKKLLSVTGNTPSEFIRLIRLRRAEQLLRKSQLTVAEVSYAVGFNNPRYFSKYFREMYELTPSQYKEKYEEK